MQRRSTGEGSISQRKDGTWCGSVQLNGQRQWVYGKTRKDVADKLQTVLGQVKATGRVSQAGNMTIETLIAEWMQQAAPRLRPTTMESYQVIAAKFLVPNLGRVKLTRLDPLGVARFYARLAPKVSKRRLESVHGLLHKVLGDAMRWGLIPSNPADAVDKPKREQKEPQLWTPAQVKQFLAMLADGQGGQYGELFAFLLASGARLGEALALRWQDFDTEAGTVRIERQLVQVGRDFHEGLPKTRSGVRTLALPDVGLAALRRQKVRNAENRLRHGESWGHEDARIFLTEAGTTPERRNVERALTSLCSHLGLPKLPVHGLRHMNLSLLAMANIPLKVAQQRAGHSSPMLTARIYQHVLGTADQEAADALSRALQA